MPNNTIRTLFLSTWYGAQLGSLFNHLPNLHRFEANIDGSIDWLSKIDKSHMSLTDVRVTLNDPLNDLDKMLHYMPNLRRLRIRGKINGNSVFEYFEKLATIIRSHTITLQRFDCELYFHSWYNQDNIIVIQQLHPLFKKIQCLLGKGINQCYATDLIEYPFYSEYTCKYRLIDRLL